MHIISTGAAWPVGVHWDVFQPLLNEKRAVAHTDAAYGVAPDNAAAERRKMKKQKMTYFFPTFCTQHGQPLQMIKRDSARVEINIAIMTSHMRRQQAEAGSQQVSEHELSTDNEYLSACVREHCSCAW